ncbi:PucR family transcriptional regulator [Embleya hyalina]|uniref:PucR family transcriptional regulator n=1 Tax=Embleya hyalina TaxID=516124 RepID=A0A401Z1F7_9ACTN|nr:helix-turn-helix domain-containing protein [Embleya hyalina]GCE00652.1 PucR family transcriptional regulator [Embleya hyalina]
MSEMSEPQRASLSRIINDLGGTFLEVIVGDVKAHEQVGAVVMHDPGDGRALPPEALVLGIGVYGASDVTELLRLLGTRNAAALIVRAPLDRAPEVLDAAHDSGVALLTLTEGADWLQLADLLRTVVAQDDVGDDVTSTLGGVSAGDLFSLANAVAALIDAPVTIEDRRYRVLAFSGRQDEADAARIRTILDRQVPEVYLREDEGRGVFKALYRTEGPLYVEASKVSENEIPRLAIAVRAGDEILGSIWAAVAGPPSPERSQALIDAGKLVALHLLRRRAGADVDHRLRADLVATALEGGPKAAYALRRLGLLGRTVNVVAMDIIDDGVHETDPSRHASDRQRLADAFAMHFSSVAARSATALLGNVSYGLIPLTGSVEQSEQRTKRLAVDFLKRTGTRVPAVIGVGIATGDPIRLDESRARADRALRVLRARGTPGTAATMSEVHYDALVLELQDLTLAHRAPVAGPLSRILEYDERRNGSLRETLECWLNAFGDIHAAAALAGVHHNTFRYRLKRLGEVGEIDLESPDERFALMLQLRLMNPAVE